jgi:hypothetical protein
VADAVAEEDGAIVREADLGIEADGVRAGVHRDRGDEFLADGGGAEELSGATASLVFRGNEEHRDVVAGVDVQQTDHPGTIDDNPAGIAGRVAVQQRGGLGEAVEHPSAVLLLSGSDELVEHRSGQRARFVRLVWTEEADMERRRGER